MPGALRMKIFFLGNAFFGGSRQGFQITYEHFERLKLTIKFWRDLHYTLKESIFINLKALFTMNHKKELPLEK